MPARPVSPPHPRGAARFGAPCRRARREARAAPAGVRQAARPRRDQRPLRARAGAHCRVPAMPSASVSRTAMRTRLRQPRRARSRSPSRSLRAHAMSNSPAAAVTIAMSTAATPKRAPATTRFLELGQQVVDDASGQTTQPGGRDLATERRLARIVAGLAMDRARGRDQLATQPLRALADVGAGTPRAVRRWRRSPRAISSRRARIGRSRSAAASHRDAASVAAVPGLGELAAEGGDLGFGVDREPRVGRWLRRARRSAASPRARGRSSRARRSAVSASRARDAGTLRLDPALGLDRERSVELREPLLVDRDSGQPGPRFVEHPVERLQAGGCHAERARDTTFGADPLHRVAKADRSPARRSRPGACRRGARSPPATARRAGARSRVRRCAAHRRRATRWRRTPPRRYRDGTARASRTRPLRSSSVSSDPPSSSTCTDCSRVSSRRATRMRRPSSSLYVSARPYAAARPGLVPRPVAALDRTTLATGIDPVQRCTHGAKQRRLAGFVASRDDGHPRMQILGQVVQRPEAGDLEALEDHRNPISAPESAMRP